MNQNKKNISNNQMNNSNDDHGMPLNYNEKNIDELRKRFIEYCEEFEKRKINFAFWINADLAGIEARNHYKPNGRERISDIFDFYTGLITNTIQTRYSKFHIHNIIDIIKSLEDFINSNNHLPRLKQRVQVMENIIKQLEESLGLESKGKRMKKEDENTLIEHHVQSQTLCVNCGKIKRVNPSQIL